MEATTRTQGQVDCVLAPRSVAIVGASGDFSKFTGRTVKHVLKHGFGGRLYLVNATKDSVAGHRSYRRVLDLPEPVDTVFVQVPPSAVSEVVDDCVALGVGSIILHGDSPSLRAGGGGLTVSQLTAERGIRVLGPNCAGIANFIDGTVLSPLVCFERDTLIAGRVALVSQSGGVTGAYVSRVTARGMGLSYVASTGNELDLDVSDFIEHLAQDESTRVIAVFLETLRDVDHFRRAATMALNHSTHLVVLKVGRSEEGARAAASHTGALAGQDPLYDALFHQMGVIRVQTLEDLVETPAMLAKNVRLNGRRVGVVTTTGGGATLMVDVAAQAGLAFPPTSSPVLHEADGPLAGLAGLANPVDVTMAGLGDVYRTVLESVLRDDAFDVVVSAVGSSSEFAPELAVTPMVDLARASERPLLAFCTPEAPAALRLLESEGVPAFRTPEGCGRALGYLHAHRRALEAISLRPRSASSNPAAIQAARQILARSTSRTLSEHDSKRVLEAYGLAVLSEAVVRTPAEAHAAAERLGYPVAVKLVSPEVPHKTDVGGVKLGVASPAALERAFVDVIEAGQRIEPRPRIDGVLVQRMAPPGLEVLIGLTSDPQFGRTILFALGGIFVEALAETSMRLLPIGERDAAEMIEETRAAKLLDHHRGLGRLDRAAVVQALLALARLGHDLDEDIEDVDVNPLIVRPTGQGVVVVDALVVRREAPGTSNGEETRRA